MEQVIETMADDGNDDDVPDVTNSRGLMTDRDRRQIARAGDTDDSAHYQAVSRVRRRLRENVAEDVEILEEHHEGLLGELREIVCEGADTDGESE